MDMKTARLMLGAAFLVAGSAYGQVYKCTDATGRIVFSDRGCNTSQQGGVVQKRTTDQQRMQADTDAYIAENEKIMRRQREGEQQAAKDAFYAEEHARQASHAQSVANNHERGQRRQQASATSSLGNPNGVGGRGMTAAQREAALASANTPEQRKELLREATTVQPGARGITASQRSAAHRLAETGNDKPIPVDREVMRRAANPPAAARPSPSPAPSQIVSCDPTGCLDNSGNRMNNAAGGNFTRSDGKFCTRINANQVICN